MNEAKTSQERDLGVWVSIFTHIIYIVIDSSLHRFISKQPNDDLPVALKAILESFSPLSAISEMLIYLTSVVMFLKTAKL